MPNSERNTQSGEFVSKYPDAAFLDALRDLGEATTTEVGNAVECDHDTARRRLTRLADSGPVERRDVARTILWSLADDASREREEAPA